MARVKNTKAKGRRGDEKAKQLAIKHGATDSMKSTASLGVFDIVAWGGGGCVFIQNKTNTRPPGIEMLGMMRAVIPAGSIKAMLVWVDRQKFPDFYLIDRHEINLLTQQEAEALLESTLNAEKRT